MKAFEDYIAFVVCWCPRPHAIADETLLVQGLPAPIVGAMVENATLFLSYTQLQNAIRWMNARPPSQDPTLPELALAGAGAGAITSFLLCVTDGVDSRYELT
jgi:ornithine carrier protein